MYKRQAANTAEVCRRLQAAAPEGIEVVDRHREYAVIAVQGPRSDEVLDALGLPTGHDYMQFREALERKQAHAGRESAGEGEGKVHDAHGPAAAQRMFRRKSGG